MADEGGWGHSRRRTGETAWSPGDRVSAGDRFSRGMTDGLVHRLFGVGLDLHAALTCVEADIGRHVAIDKIHTAIRGLDAAIKDFRGVVFDLSTGGSPPDPPVGLRTLVVQAVERACGPDTVCPAITLGRGVDTVLDAPMSQLVARLIHRVLMLVPRDRLPDTRVEVTARPPGRLVVHIDAPAGDLSVITERMITGSRISCQALTRSRIRLECRAS